MIVKENNSVDIFNGITALNQGNNGHGDIKGNGYGYGYVSFPDEKTGFGNEFGDGYGYGYGY